jgi:uncharacterized protein YjeT (DUF2065 family)
VTDLLAASGLVLVIEGLLWAAVPQPARRLALSAAQMPDATLRLMGASAVAAGVLVVWLARA